MQLQTQTIIAGLAACLVLSGAFSVAGAQRNASASVDSCCTITGSLTKEEASAMSSKGFIARAERPLSAVTMHVEYVHVGWTFSSVTSRPAYYRVQVRDEFGNPVYGALVTGSWSGCFSQTGQSAITGDQDSNGDGIIQAEEQGVAYAVSTRTANCKNRQCTFIFTVTNVSRSGDSYNPSQNVMTFGSRKCNPFLP